MEKSSADLWQCYSTSLKLVVTLLQLDDPLSLMGVVALVFMTNGTTANTNRG